MSHSESPTGIDWQLLAIDGVVHPAAASLRIEADGTMRGRAPCNSWGTTNRAALPKLEILGIRATRMACDRMAEEQLFFDALAAMTEARMNGSRNLILSGPGGRSMEFVTDRTNSLTVCKTCPPEDQAQQGR
jgi:heat shock protein HslJ